MTAEVWHKGLTERQRRFCEAYAANGGNAVASARDAGYKHPDVQGIQNLAKLSIVAALENLRANHSNAAIATREERQSFWTRIMHDDGEDMRHRLKASELLGKSQADFLERHEHKQVFENGIMVNFIKSE